MLVPELARLAAGADVLVTVLPGSGEVRELMLGAGGVAAALRAGTTWIDMTSNSPAAMTEVRDAVLDRGVQVLDAPAGGGVAAAQHGSLQLLVGGEAQVPVPDQGQPPERLLRPAAAAREPPPPTPA